MCKNFFLFTTVQKFVLSHDQKCAAAFLWFTVYRGQWTGYKFLSTNAYEELLAYSGRTEQMLIKPHQEPML